MAEPTPAELAGWNPEDGKPPCEHGEPVAPLDADVSLDELRRRIAVEEAEER